MLFSVHRTKRDVIKFGDKRQQQIIDKINDAQTTLALQQMIRKVTRIQAVEGNFEKSIIDNVYCNSTHIISEVKVIPAGLSNHLGLVVKKFRKSFSEHPRSFKIRNFDNLP